MRHDGLQSTARPPSWGERLLGRPGRARTGSIVALLLTLLALEFAAWAVFTPAGPGNETLDTALAALLALLALAALLLQRTEIPWWPTAVLVTATVVVLVGVATRLSAQGQSVLGADVVLVSVVSAYLLPRRTFVLLLAGTVAVYLGVTLGRDLGEPFYPVVLSIAAVVTSMLVADLVRLLEDGALLDPLTGALNRDGLATQAAVVGAVSARAGGATSVVVIDVDRFKSYNDEHGHAAGDAVLVALTAAWRAHLREGDLLARTGGDEFVVLLPGSADRDARAVVERLRQSGPVPWSYGATEWHHDEPLERAVARADAALLEDKARRRSG